MKLNPNHPTRVMISDRKFFVSCLLAAIVVGSFTFLIGQAMTPRGSKFLGNKVIAAGDYSVYYSYINQGRAGHLMMYDAFTSEAHRPTLIQPVWLVVGLLARLTGLSTPIAFALARLLATPLLVWALWWAARWLWPDDRLKQRTGMLLSLFAGGFGGLAAFLSMHSVGSVLWAYPDLWVSEAFTTLTLVSSAHFILVTSGIIFVLVAVERSWLEHKWSWALWAGAAALAVFSIHPFHLVTWSIVWVILTIWRTAVNRRVPWDYVKRWLTVIAIGSPMLLLYGLQLLFDPITIGRAAQNINRTGPVWGMAVGLGLLLIGAVIGTWYWRPRDERWRWLVALAIGYALAIYAPVLFQRRLSQGLMLPFAWLSVPAVVAGLTPIRHRLAAWPYGLFATATVLLTFSWLVVGILIVRDYFDELHGQPRFIYYLNTDYQSAATFLRATDPHQPLLTPLLEGNILAGLTAHQVFIGYGVETLNSGQKAKLVKDFYQTMNATEQHTLLAQWRLCYVLDSPWTRAYGQVFQPTNWPDLTLAWSGSKMRIYRTPYCRKDI